MPDSARVDHSLARMQLDPVLLAVNLLDEGLVTGQRNDHFVAGGMAFPASHSRRYGTLFLSDGMAEHAAPNRAFCTPVPASGSA
jgi:hypothetical protein